MAAFDSCCCCSLRAGTIFIGVLSLLLSLGSGGLCCLLVSVDKLQEVIQAAYNTYYDLQNPIKVYGANGTETGPEELNLEDPILMYIEWGVIATLLFMFVCTVVDVLLIIAAIREAPWMMIPWMVVQWVTIFLTIIIFGIVLWQLVAMPRYWWAVMFVVAVVILMMMAFVLVLSLYQSVRERELPEYYQGAELVHRHIWLSQKGKYYE